MSAGRTTPHGGQPGSVTGSENAGAPSAETIHGAAVDGRTDGAGGPGQEFERLLAVMDRLRSPGGCPWDGEQTHESLLRYLVEEAYEVVEAVEAPDPSRPRRVDLVEELGDVLLQVVFHARIGEEHEGRERFDVSDVIEAVTTKLVRRHPEVFPPEAEEPGAAASSVPALDDTAPSEAELAARWDAVKRAEKPQRTRVFDGIPPALPALAYGEKALSKARRHGVGNVSPETAELTPRQREDEERELGERLLGLLRESSARGLDAERALRTAVRRFTRENDRPVSP
ncbi:nucleoside triphosphate pyrophosphohydrolase [Kocuria varians]|uniref:Nucleoside triphosphate pyrophosphohydrolase n=1 Tax=Kocuria varians TaxID=1272 RepID=A0A4Y4D3R6_KOCVA|nr:MazG nucleotide pyrophosphohydrolase domain-containing protein [Kocuria varians]GEC98354.1 nucleoside triphosphate pyrophosphohydrolase [Kocuria varians]